MVFAVTLDTVEEPATLVKPTRTHMPLAHPIPLRLAPEQLEWLDSWRGNTFSRSTAIRLLVDEGIRLHRDGILPATKR
jgi:hypothetical protein